MTPRHSTFVSLTEENNPTMNTYQSRGVNVSYRRRIRQIVVLVFTIVMGVLISQATQAHMPSGEGQSVVTSGR